MPCGPAPRQRRPLPHRWRRAVPLGALLLAARAGPAGGAQAGPEGFRPKYALVDGDIETVWQRPRAADPKGIVFVAHGCMHQGTDIFSDVGPDGWRFEECATSNFGRCLGLPEEVKLRKAARRRGYVVVAVSGGTGRQSCWDHDRDRALVARAISYVREAEGLDESLPVLAIGASSGGAFVGKLAAPVADGGLPNLKCIVPEIMATRGAPNRGIPTLFVHMPRDTRTSEAVARDLLSLHRQGVRAAEIRVGPVPVVEELLLDCLPMKVARDVVQALRAAGLLDGGGLLKRDPRARLWVPHAQRAIAGRSNDTLVADESCVAELLNVAWAQHEFTAKYAEQILDFCEEEPTGSRPSRGVSGEL